MTIDTLDMYGHRIRIFGEADPRAVEQLETCLAVEDGSRGVLCADNHVGYSQPIGGAVAYRDSISPSGVGYDIACGNKAVRTNLKASELTQADREHVMDEIVRRISFGIGRVNNESVDHPVFDSIANANFEPQRALHKLAVEQLGTVGAGNHYVDLFEAEDGAVWVGVHFGSRGFGHKTATGFLAMAQGLPFSEKERKDLGLKVAGGEMFSPPVTFPMTSEAGQSYIEAMNLAGEYAYAGRDLVCEKVLEILGGIAVEEVHNHHNFAWREEHDGVWYWVVRKGCTPAGPGQLGFVGSTMGETSVILEGTQEAESAMFSTVHGAGRVMSRTQAKGKQKRKKVWQCMDRDCDRTFPKIRNQHPQKGLCPDHPNARIKVRTIFEQKSKGLIDFDAAKADLETQNIILRGGDADEAPGAYKRLHEVLADHGDTIRVLHHLVPIGVAMAGADTFDPFKD